MTTDAWFASRTHGAPVALRERAALFFAAEPAGDPATRCAAAGRRALSAAMSARSRDGALDLLAADALITLALLAVAEGDPAGLGERARLLREQAT